MKLNRNSSLFVLMKFRKTMVSQNIYFGEKFLCISVRYLICRDTSDYDGYFILKSIKIKMNLLK